MLEVQVTFTKLPLISHLFVFNLAFRYISWIFDCGSNSFKGYLPDARWHTHLHTCQIQISDLTNWRKQIHNKKWLKLEKKTSFLFSERSLWCSTSRYLLFVLPKQFNQLSLFIPICSQRCKYKFTVVLKYLCCFLSLQFRKKRWTFYS